MKHQAIYQIKQELKAIVGQIRAHREVWKRKSKDLCWEFRHKHIAYCLVRGKTMDEIENPRFCGGVELGRTCDAKLYTYYQEIYQAAIDKEKAEAQSA